MSRYSLTLFCQNDLSKFKYFIVRDLKKKITNPWIGIDRTGLEEMPADGKVQPFCPGWAVGPEFLKVTTDTQSATTREVPLT